MSQICFTETEFLEISKTVKMLVDHCVNCDWDGAPTDKNYHIYRMMDLLKEAGMRLQDKKRGK